ncbi:MAG: hypothetical protein AABX47_03050 [Nanoarchaeota archaeon]
MNPLTEELRSKLASLLGEDHQLVTQFSKASLPWRLLDILEKAQDPFNSQNHGKVHHSAVIEGKVFISKGAIIQPFTFIQGPAFIGPNSIIGPHAYIRPATIIGADCHVSTSTVKNSIILSRSNVPHYSYVGDSIISEDCNFGAGSQTANLRLDNKPIKVKIGDAVHDSGRVKLGCILESGIKLACATILNPGTYVKKGTMLLGSTSYKGYVEAP